MEQQHLFHIPVMGTGHSVDTPIRVAPFGISSVISLVDDILLERIRKFYCEEYDLPYERLLGSDIDGRAKRITAYLNMVKEIVHIKLEAIRNQPFFTANDKRKYFELLPDSSPLRVDYQQLLAMEPGPERDALAKDLTGRMQPGSIDVNIMVKLDRVNYDKDGQPLDDEYRDTKSALRGFANSDLDAAIVFSAGINQTLYSYMAKFRDFYHDQTGRIKKRIVLKVSDFRSALIQGKFLAKKGLEVFEYRIESGLNCGGHAFPSQGHLLPSLLNEFREKRDQLVAELRPLIRKFYASMGWEPPEWAEDDCPLVTVQGGIGNHGEVRRMMEDFGMDMTGWATPFLLVPEATSVDAETREQLRRARDEDLYTSDVSPLGVAFNNMRDTGSEVWTRERASAGKPGSPCPKGFLVSNTEFTEQPICTASREFQKQKLEQIEAEELSDAEKEQLRARVLQKQCICDHLGNGALRELGIVNGRNTPQSICPGPNIAWFDDVYTLQQMVDHIYGRGPSLVPPERPHMFAKELTMYVDYFGRLATRDGTATARLAAELEKFRANLEAGIELCLDIAKRAPFPGENLASIPPVVAHERERLHRILADFTARLHAASPTPAPA